MINFFSLPSSAGLLQGWSLTGDKDGYTGLHWAAVNNHSELLELLLAQTGVDVNVTNNEDETPLMMACFAGRENIVRKEAFDEFNDKRI